MFLSKMIFTTSDFFNAIINQISYRPKICYIFVKHWQFVKERFLQILNCLQLCLFFL